VDLGFNTTIQKKVGGVLTTIATGAVNPWVAGDQLTATIFGSSLRMYRNGALILSAIDTSLQTGSSVGLGISHATGGNVNQIQLRSFSCGDFQFSPIAGLSQTAFDDFDRADGVLGSAWSGSYTGYSDLAIVNKKVRSSATNDDCMMTVVSPTQLPDQWARMAIAHAAQSGLQAPQLALRVAASPTDTLYVAYIIFNLPNMTAIDKHIATAVTTLFSTRELLWEVGDEMLFVATGTGLNIYKIPFLSATPILMASIADASIASGQPGLWMFTGTATADVEVDNFQCGNVQPLFIQNQGIALQQRVR
jgi:hypothetical protein